MLDPIHYCRARVAPALAGHVIQGCLSALVVCPAARLKKDKILMSDDSSARADGQDFLDGREAARGVTSSLIALCGLFDSTTTGPPEHYGEFERVFPLFIENLRKLRSAWPRIGPRLEQAARSLGHADVSGCRVNGSSAHHAIRLVGENIELLMYLDGKDEWCWRGVRKAFASIDKEDLRHWGGWADQEEIWVMPDEPLAECELEPAGDGKPGTCPDDGNTAKETGKKEAAWYYDDGEDRPVTHDKGPLYGTKKDLGIALGGPGGRNDRTLESKAKSGVVWVRRLTGKNWEVWFKLQSQYAAANAKML